VCLLVIAVQAGQVTLADACARMRRLSHHNAFAMAFLEEIDTARRVCVATSHVLDDDDDDEEEISLRCAIFVEFAVS
jgi:hypothetical protein